MAIDDKQVDAAIKSVFPSGYSTNGADERLSDEPYKVLASLGQEVIDRGLEENQVVSEEEGMVRLGGRLGLAILIECGENSASTRSDTSLRDELRDIGDGQVGTAIDAVFKKISDTDEWSELENTLDRNYDALVKLGRKIIEVTLERGSFFNLDIINSMEWGWWLNLAILKEIGERQLFKSADLLE